MSSEVEMISRTERIPPDELDFWKVGCAVNDFNASHRGHGRRVEVQVDRGRDGYVIRSRTGVAVNVATGPEVMAFFRGHDWGVANARWTDLAVTECDGGWAVVEACPDAENVCETYAVSSVEGRMAAFAAGCRATRRLH